MQNQVERTIPQSRLRLSELINGAGDVIRIDDVTRILHLGRIDAAKLLSRWTSQGWLRHVARGVYAPASLETLTSRHVVSDPWVLVPSLFANAYVGGRSAAEHWDLTEQIFNDIVVITSAPIREKSQVLHGITFTVKHVAPEKVFGTKVVWRGRTKVAVSDVHRTIVDMLDDPALGGGIQHVAECLADYLGRKDRDDDRLIEYADRLGNRAVFKRLGFLAEREDGKSALIKPCLERLSKGVAKLDPALVCPRTISRWNLRVPIGWAETS